MTCSRRAIRVSGADLADNLPGIAMPDASGSVFALVRLRDSMILSETDSGVRRSRLGIAELVARKELELCLDLLGIATPERM